MILHDYITGQHWNVYEYIHVYNILYKNENTLRDACDVTVIVIENGHGNPSSNPKPGCLYIT